VEDTAAGFYLPPINEEPFQGVMLDNFLDKVERWIFIQRLSAKARKKVKVNLPNRRAQLLCWLKNQQKVGGFLPAKLLQLQRLHRLLLFLRQPEQANGLVSRWGDILIQIATKEAAIWEDEEAGISVTICNEIRIHLLLADSDSRFYFDRAGGLESLYKAAKLIGLLPAYLDNIEIIDENYFGTICFCSPNDYWQAWGRRAEGVYKDSTLMQYGCKLEKQQIKRIYPNQEIGSE